jgi:hypothetical protein
MEVNEMQHTNDEIDRAARRFEQLADELDPDTTEVDHTDDLRQVATIAQTLRNRLGGISPSSTTKIR